MTPIRQGEKLMLLVKRDSRSTEEIAEAMGIDKSYLPKLYKMDKLPTKPLQRALQVFGVDAAYFTDAAEIPLVVAEPDVVYKTIKGPADTPLAQLQAENAALQMEIARLTKMLEQERSVNANLAEALRNLSKRP
ncbi:MAG: hypothetical protein KDC61_09740 [Saprospiraceae bacterium]|nr:hypothetical protein [Saprospiraceae bacterium]MCB0545608.1 hypothetical protein [Saprospiraceae bacterium]MCB0574834.1 hypothetical protein [Saprospiraceae bacterium]MCB9355258.1 hypothetical protein [Lewinellaceae bacterium]